MKKQWWFFYIFFQTWELIILFFCLQSKAYTVFYRFWIFAIVKSSQLPLDKLKNAIWWTGRALNVTGGLTQTL